LTVTATTTLNSFVVVAPTRQTDNYSYGLDINTDNFFRGGAAQKSYLLSVRGDREAEYPASGDSNDAYIKVGGSNYAYNDGNFIFRGINSGINNRSGGYLGTLEGASIGAQNKSGGYASTTNAMTLTAENYGTVTDRFGGLDILLKNEAAVATTEYGLRLRNENNSLATEVGAGVLLTDTGANNGWTYGIDMSGATVGVAEIVLKTTTAGEKTIIASGSASDDAAIVTDVGADSTIADGSLYLEIADGAGSLWIKKADTWTEFTSP